MKTAKYYLDEANKAVPHIDIFEILIGMLQVIQYLSMYAIPVMLQNLVLSQAR